MRLPLVMRVFLACCAAPLPVLIFAIAVYAQVSTGAGLVSAVDVGRNTVVLETRTGSQPVLVAPTATIRDDDGKVLALGDIRPGDAVAYHGVSGTATSLHVARQFWAIPSER